MSSISSRNILSKTGVSPKKIGRLKRPLERADIVIWDRKGASIIIEVKKMTNGRGLEADARKIRVALKKKTSLVGGVLVGPFRFSVRKKVLKEKTKEFSKRKDVRTEKYTCIRVEYGQNKKREAVFAGAGIFFIEEKRS